MAVSELSFFQELHNDLLCGSATYLRLCLFFVSLSVDGHGNHSCVCTVNTDVQGSLSRDGIAGFYGSFTLIFLEEM